MANPENNEKKWKKAVLQSENCKKQMERRIKVRRKSVTQSFTLCGAEFLRYFLVLL